MRLAGHLDSSRRHIVDRWTELAFQVYPEKALGFLRGRDRFRNPVGHVTRQSLDALFEGLVQESRPEDLKEPLDAILRVRAVQDLAPSQAVAFLPRLKHVVREAVEACDSPLPLDKELDDFFDAIDRLTLLAFDLYVECRETIYRLRISEIKSRAASPLERRQTAEREQSGGCGA